MIERTFTRMRRRSKGRPGKKNKKRGEKERKRGPRWLKNITHRHKDTIKRGDTRGDGRELRRK